MHFTQITALATALLAASVSATPMPQVPVPGGDAPGQAFCSSMPGNKNVMWGIYVPGTTMPRKDDPQHTGAWGGALYDQLASSPRTVRKAGCRPSNWQAQVDKGNPQGVGVSFETDTNCQITDIINMLHTATDGTWVVCSGNSKSTQWDTTGQVFSGVTSGMSQVAGLLGQFGGAVVPKN